MRKLYSEATLYKLREAIVSLLLQKEYSKITISDIAQCSGINRTTFYMFYSSKEELVRDLWGEVVESHIAHLPAMMSSDKQVMLTALQEVMGGSPQRKRTLRALLRIREGGFIPYLDMIDRFEKRNMEMLPESLEDHIRVLFAKYHANCSATTIAWWAEKQDDDFTVADICEIQYTCMHKGMVSLLT